MVTDRELNAQMRAIRVEHFIAGEILSERQECHYAVELGLAAGLTDSYYQADLEDWWMYGCTNGMYRHPLK